MSATVIVGLQFGDEGKGKIIDRAAGDFDVVIRYNGGANAGHTVENALGVFKLHLVPSGIFNPAALCILGNGAVVDPDVLLKELDELAAAGVDTRNFRLSSRAHLVMPWHKVADKASEAAKGSAAIGTTGRGIGPCYGDKVARVGIRAGELCDPVSFAARIAASGRGDAPSPEDILRWSARLAPLIDDTDVLAREALARGKRVLLEAAQGTMIDLECGTYPFVTSSYATSAGACIGSGLPPTAIGKVVGVAKAYTTRVGNGPFVTELLDEIGERLRKAGNEFGTTTGRPRRCGWFDIPLARYAAEVNGTTEIVLTKLDVLSALPALKVCVGYVRGGMLLSRPPGPAVPYEGCKPAYVELPGWSSPIAGVTRWDGLPPEARAYVEYLEAEVGVRIAAVATGPHRDAIITR
ncbi:MAG TPA: adenylosuccinate synthase [Candidatus Binatia bacterium]|nr:adenylosuccinate synthase [Candidatus Binatia bacterium]